MTLRIFVPLLFATTVFAQVDHANLTGTVLDPSGSPIPGATVTVPFIDTGAKRTVPTGSSGIYVLAALPIGTCSLIVRANGFQEQKTDQLRLSVGETRTLNFQLGI